MKVVVYAICKNEAQFVERWMNSMSEADQVVVLDTGSTDDTAERLRAQGAEVTTEIISPWRFDVARNRSLDLVPPDADICVCTDLDEVFHPGWRTLLEQAWVPGVGQATYRYTWSFHDDGTEGVVFWSEKIHARHGYRWTHPVHEVLAWVGEGTHGTTVAVEGIQLDHYPDPSKSRGQYLPLLELSVEEDPQDDRNIHYLGREYMYKGRWDDCIRTLKHHLTMPSATWQDERAASMRYIAKSYYAKRQITQAAGWYHRAIAEAPHLREPYMDFAHMLYDQKDWVGVLYFTQEALKIKVRPQTYICEAESWGSRPYDLASLAHYYLGQYDQARDLCALALGFSPTDQRLLGNYQLMCKQCEAEETLRQEKNPVK